MHGTAEGASDTRECDHPAHPDRTGAAIRGARRFLLKRAMLAERERVSNFNLLACHGVSLAVAAVGQL